MASTAIIEPAELDQGPVLVQIEYITDQSKLQAFAKAMQDLSIIRKRDSAFYGGLFRHYKKETYTLKVF